MFPTVIVKGFSGLLVVLLVFSDVQGWIFEDDGGTKVCLKPIHQNVSSKRWEGKFCDTDLLPTTRYNKNSISASINENSRQNMWRQHSREFRGMDEARRGSNQNWRRVNNLDDISTRRDRWATEFNRGTRSADNLKARQRDTVRSINIRLERTRNNQDRRSFGNRNIRSERTYAGGEGARIDSRSYTRSNDVRSARVARSVPSIHEKRSSDVGFQRRIASPLNTRRSSFSRELRSIETRSERYRLSAPEHIDTRRSPGTALSREENRAVPSRMNERRTESTRRFVGIRTERDIVNERRLSPGVERSNSRSEAGNRSSRRGEESRRIVRGDSNIPRVYSSSRSADSESIPRNIRTYQRSEVTERSRSSIPLLNERNTVRATQERFRNEDNSADSLTRRNINRSQSEMRGNLFYRSVEGQRGFERIREFGNDRRQRQNSEIRRRVSSDENRMRFTGIRVREVDTMEQRRARTISSRGSVRRQQEFAPEARTGTRRNGRDYEGAKLQRDFNSRLENWSMNGRSYRVYKMSGVRRLVDSKSENLSRESSMRNVQTRTRSDVKGIVNEINSYMNQKARFVPRANNRDAKRSRIVQSGHLSSERRTDNPKEMYGGLKELVEAPGEVFGNWHGALQITLASILLGQLMFSRRENLKRRWFPGNWIKLQVF